MAAIYLGEFEYAVLLATLHLDQEGYAVPIRELIEARTGRPVARGALYTALDRLEGKGCLRSRMGDSTDERGGNRFRAGDVELLSTANERAAIHLARILHRQAGEACVEYRISAHHRRGQRRRSPAIGRGGDAEAR